ncbi:MAG: hypothetical protein AAGC53_07960 [Actinomycetota bacterium]
MSMEQHAEQDWEAKVADQIIDRVDQVKRIATDNAVLALRGLVFGLVAAVLGFALLVMGLIAALRFLDAYLPIGNGVGDAVWAAYLVIGVFFSLLGLGMWMSRRKGLRPFWIALATNAILIVVIACYGAFS